MSLINVTNLTFAYEGAYDNVFEQVSFQIDSNWKLGFIGRNGRGKTTFLKLLLGKYKFGGTISSKLEFEYFPYVVNDPKKLTLEVVEELHPSLESWKLYRELNLLKVDLDVLYCPFEVLSKGEQTKILLAVLFLKDNVYLLIDEPTNHLDNETRKLVATYLSTKNGFILVSHDRMFLDQCIDHVLSINKNNIEIQKGDFSSWYKNKQEQDQHEILLNGKLEADVKRLREASRRTAIWSDKLEHTKNGTKNSGLRPDRGYIGHKSAKIMKRSKAIENRRENAIIAKSQLLKNVEASDSLHIYPLEYHKERLVLFDNVDMSYNHKMICKNICFEICRGDRICLSGKNGSGKSSVLKLILKETIDYSGNKDVGSGLKISYVSQDASHLEGDLSSYAKEAGIEEHLFKSLLRKLDLERIQFEKNIQDFSAGQKKKVLIARSLCEQAHLYIWDEPLNYIDVFSRIQIEEFLMKYKPTIIFVEHDRIFSHRIATKIVEL